MTATDVLSIVNLGLSVVFLAMVLGIIWRTRRHNR